MLILKHKGNSPAAFRQTLSAGFGVELDVRDRGSALVVSHDMPGGRHVALEGFFRTYASLNSQLPLALNIKACGLQDKLLTLLNKFRILNYFVFDMAVPDGVGYFKRGMTIFTRQSEYERVPAYYDKASGIWLDEFNERWISLAAIRGHLKNRKKICIVSPELHKRSFRARWADLKRIERITGHDRLMLCTDYPPEAEKYFNGHD